MKPIALLVLSCTAFALHLGAFANAQMSQEASQRALVGLNSIGFFVEQLDDDDKVCGITEGAVRDAFMYPISSSRLRFSRGLSGPIFHVQITTILQRQPRQCISSVMVHVFDLQNVTLDFAIGSAPEVALVLWNGRPESGTGVSRPGLPDRTGLRGNATGLRTLPRPKFGY
jgi:hypothetical protein